VEAGGNVEHAGPSVGGSELGESFEEEAVGGFEAFFPGWCCRVARPPKGSGVCGDGGHGSSGCPGVVGVDRFGCGGRGLGRFEKLDSVGDDVE